MILSVRGSSPPPPTNRVLRRDLPQVHANKGLSIVGASIIRAMASLPEYFEGAEFLAAREKTALTRRPARWRGEGSLRPPRPTYETAAAIMIEMPMMIPATTIPTAMFLSSTSSFPSENGVMRSKTR